jgi:hypothetical protein
MRGGDVGQRVRACDHDLQRAGRDPVDELEPCLSADLGSGIGAGRAAEHFHPGCERGRGRDDRRDAIDASHQFARDLERLGSPDTVDRGVDAVRRDRTYPFEQPGSVHDRFCTQLLQPCVVRLPRGSDDACAPIDGDLDRHGADSTRGAVEQHRVARPGGDDGQRVSCAYATRGSNARATRRERERSVAWLLSAPGPRCRGADAGR